MKTKRILPFLLALTLLLALFPTVAMASGESSNVNIKVNASAPKVGETFTVTVSNKAMTVTSFTCGISFDNTKLSCVAVTTDAGYDKLKAYGPAIPAQLSTKEQANSSGRVGFGIAYSSAHSYEAADIFTVTFKVLAKGDISITGYENSGGADGCNTDATPAAAPVAAVKAEEAAEAAGLLGDVNNDGRVNQKDVARLRQYIADATNYPLDAPDNADVNKDGRVNQKDVARLRQYIADSKTYPLG